MSIGYIYKITNNINGKIYIGQTANFYEIRWNEHKSKAFNKNYEGYGISLYRAFRKYGLNNFLFEIVEICDISELDNREIYWIKFYDSYSSGYNETLGGSGSKLLQLDEKEIIKKYKEIGTIAKTASYFSCSNSSIRSILKKNNINITSAVQHQKNKGYIILQFDLDKNLINKFCSRFELGKWLLENNLSQAKTCLNAGNNIVSRLNKKNVIVSYNYIWCFDGNQSYINNFSVTEKESKEISCPICGEIKDFRAKLCSECYHKF